MGWTMGWLIYPVLFIINRSLGVSKYIIQYVKTNQNGKHIHHINVAMYIDWINPCRVHDTDLQIFPVNATLINENIIIQLDRNIHDSPKQ